MPDPKDVQQPDRESTAVVYDPADGRIVHWHTHSTLHGGTHPDEQSLKKDALRHASLTDPSYGTMPVLHLDPRGIKPDANYRVDPHKRILLEEPK